MIYTSRLEAGEARGAVQRPESQRVIGCIDASHSLVCENQNTLGQEKIDVPATHSTVLFYSGLQLIW